jgi:hypothetical protein
MKKSTPLGNLDELITFNYLRSLLEAIWRPRAV